MQKWGRAGAKLHSALPEHRVPPGSPSTLGGKQGCRRASSLASRYRGCYAWRSLNRASHLALWLLSQRFGQDHWSIPSRCRVFNTHVKIIKQPFTICHYTPSTDYAHTALWFEGSPQQWDGKWCHGLQPFWAVDPLLYLQYGNLKIVSFPPQHKNNFVFGINFSLKTLISILKHFCNLKCHT